MDSKGPKKLHGTSPRVVIKWLFLWAEALLQDTQRRSPQLHQPVCCNSQTLVVMGPHRLCDATPWGAVSFLTSVWIKDFYDRGRDTSRQPRKTAENITCHHHLCWPRRLFRPTGLRTCQVNWHSAEEKQRKAAESWSSQECESAQKLHW
jgi:hypothetical protein